MFKKITRGLTTFVEKIKRGLTTVVENDKIDSNTYLREVLSWKFDYEASASNITITYDNNSEQISISDNSKYPEDATRNIDLLTDQLKSRLTRGKKVSQKRYSTDSKEKDKYCRRVEFNITHLSSIKGLPLLEYLYATKNIDGRVIDTIVDNLIDVILNLDLYMEKKVEDMQGCGSYVRIPILNQDGYPPLAMFLDTEDGEISMGVGSNGGMSNGIMKYVVGYIEDRVKKHEKLRKYFYENPLENDEHLQEKEKSVDGHFSRLYLTKGLLGRIKADCKNIAKNRGDEDESRNSGRPSPEPRKPINAISLQEKTRVFNIFNKHSDSEPLSIYSSEEIEGLKREFKQKQEDINQNISDREFLNPKKYSGIGIKAQYNYIEDLNSKFGGRWIFNIEEVFENSPAAKIGFEPGESITVEGQQNALKKIVQEIRDGKLEIIKGKLKATTSVFELNEGTNKYELFNFEKSFQRSALTRA